ncbi:MAG: beta-N-acetylhexosaminidase [Halanaerobiales bacterium]
MNLLPGPRELILHQGRHFTLDKGTNIALDKSCSLQDFDTARLLQQVLKEQSGQPIGITRVINLKKGKLLNDKIIYLKRIEDSEDKITTIMKKQKIEESYRISIKEKIIEVTARSEAGLFYGVQTLKQLICSEGLTIPCLDINDNPYFAYRGFYHDVTRGKVPTLDTLKELVDRISFYKINQLQLYVEHTFAFKNMSEIWSGADPLTAEEIMELDQYCQKRHVELVPSLSTFGHLYEALTTSTYNHLAELDAGPEDPYSWIDRQRHHTLDVSNPESFQFVQDMLDQYIPLFSSDKFNICCDETFDLGEGKNQELAEKIGKGRLYVNFLSRIIDYVKGYNKELMFWGDIIIQHPELLDEIPDDVICLNWEYDAEPDEEKVKTVAQSGIKQYLCPGVSGWNKLMNDMDTAYSNIENMIKYGKKYEAIGILNTDWGDYGHINLLANSIPGMIFAAALSWNPEMDLINEVNDNDSTKNEGLERYSVIDQRISLVEFQDQEEKIVSLLRKLARQQIVDWGMIIRWKETKYEQTTFDYNMEKVFSKVAIKDLKDSYDKSLSLAENILELSNNKKERYRQDFTEFYNSAQGIALLNALALIIKREEYNEEVRELILSPEELAGNLEYWLYDYKKLWRARNKESELYRIGETIDQLCEYLRGV